MPQISNGFTLPKSWRSRDKTGSSKFSTSRDHELEDCIAGRYDVSRSTENLADMFLRYDPRDVSVMTLPGRHRPGRQRRFATVDNIFQKPKMAATSLSSMPDGSSTDLLSNTVGTSVCNSGKMVRRTSSLDRHLINCDTPDSEDGGDNDDIAAIPKSSLLNRLHHGTRKTLRSCQSLISSDVISESFDSTESSDEVAAETGEAGDIRTNSDTCQTTEPAYLSRRKRSSADLGIFYPGDLLSQTQPHRPGRRFAFRPPPLIKANSSIAVFANTKAYQSSTASLISAASEQDKKTKSPFTLLKLKHRSKDATPQDLNAILENLKRSEFKYSYLLNHKDSHWMDLLASSDRDRDISLSISPVERRRREAVWELFTSECAFFIDRLMVLKHCFMEPLKQIQSEGMLAFVDVDCLFGNLEEICQVSSSFCHEFLKLLLSEMRSDDFGNTRTIIQGLQMFCDLTHDGEVYHHYCLNYSKAKTCLTELRKNEDFKRFERWCERDVRCHRLHLNDLLASPMQHGTKVPLLVSKICEHTKDCNEKQVLNNSLEKLENSLKNLNDKMKWLKNYERVQEIQTQVVWPSVMELDSKAYVPESMRFVLNSSQPCHDQLFDCSTRELILEGSLQLIEIAKAELTRAIDMYLLLFDDLLLLSRIKKQAKKQKTVSGTSESLAKIVPADGTQLIVHKQPISLDKLTVYSFNAENEGTPGNNVSTIRNAFVLVQRNRFRQVIGIFTLQASSETDLVAWTSGIIDAQEKHRKRMKRRNQLYESLDNIDYFEECVVGGNNNDPSPSTAPRLSPVSESADWAKMRAITNGARSEPHRSIQASSSFDERLSHPDENNITRPPEVSTADVKLRRAIRVRYPGQTNSYPGPRIIETAGDNGTAGIVHSHSRSMSNLVDEFRSRSNSADGPNNSCTVRAGGRDVGQTGGHAGSHASSHAGSHAGRTIAITSTNRPSSMLSLSNRSNSNELIFV